MRKYTKKFGVIAFVCGCVTGIGCSGTATGRFDAMGYHDHTENYSIAFPTEGSNFFVSDSWELENWENTPEGHKVKAGNHFESTYVLRWKTRRPTTIHYRTHDVRLKNRQDSSLMWVSTIPVDEINQEKSLSVLFEEYLTADSGPLSLAAHRAMDSAGVTNSAEASLVEGNEGLFNGLEAYAGTVTVSGSAENKGRIAFVQLPRPGRVIYSTRSGARDYADVPLLLVIGYLGGSETFDQHLQDFSNLVEAISVTSGVGGETRGIIPDVAPAPIEPTPSPEPMEAEVTSSGDGNDEAVIEGAEGETPAQEGAPSESEQPTQENPSPEAETEGASASEATPANASSQ